MTISIIKTSKYKTNSKNNMRTFDVLLFLVIAYTWATVNGNVYFHAKNPNNEWWSNTITYQVYPRSFKDSNNDGIGDLKGIIQKLDHFVDLGIETLWIGPLFKSPMDDMGYDVEDYRMIDPIYGTMADFDELVLEMKKRNLKLVTDFIPNHSSYKCEWFQRSIKQEGKYADYYMWRDASNQEKVLRNKTVKPKPPNNWDIIAFWMDRGVVGFRFDALAELYESNSFLDEPCLTNEYECTMNHDSLKHIYTVDQPENIDIIHEWREFIDDYFRSKNISISSFLATESYSPINVLLQFYGNSTKPGANVPFNFGLLSVDT